MHTVHFTAEAAHSGWNAVPWVDGTPLAELVADYEGRRGFDVAGTYGPLWFDAASREDLRRLLLPASARSGPSFDLLGRRSRFKRVSLLECECEIPGCWPLEARVDSVEELVRWHSFRQPHRPDRDYSGLGPFHFAAAAYRDAVCALLDR